MNVITELTAQLLWLLAGVAAFPLVAWLVRLAARCDARRRYKRFYEDRDE